VNRFAVVSDIHGNLPALEAVLAEIHRAGVEAVLNLGDIASGPLWPAETCARLMALGWPTIRGNHERQAVLEPRERMGPADAYAADALTPAQAAWLAALPVALRSDADIVACHATPASDLQYGLETVEPDGRVRMASADEVRRRFPQVTATLLLCGHTHVPRAVQVDGLLVVNPGSVGLQAYDDDHPVTHWIENGSPHARWAVVERSARGWSVQQRLTAYDWEAAARRAQANGRGDWADALRHGRVGRTEKDVIAG
jgi:predicted phosphodiesterase